MNIYHLGEEVELIVDREGLGEDEGVAHLADDTMVVVVGAGSKVGQRVKAVINTAIETYLGPSLMANAL